MPHRQLPTLVAFLLALSPSPGAQDMRAVKVADGLLWPVWLGSPPGEHDRLFVVEPNRGIRILEHGLLRPTYFLNLTGTLPLAGEGFHSMAFHPDYAANGLFYTLYTDRDGDSRLSQWTTSADPYLADPGSEVVLLGPVTQPDPLNHNWHGLAFGPDGMLYVSTGDGGFSNDPDNNGQRLDVLFGKILRLDVDSPPAYIPPDNPFVGVPGVREEIWAYGLRAPWRISFDRLTGDLWIGDVGESAREEINFQPRSSTGGENYGWRCVEGTQCTSNGGCSCADPALVPPVFDYPHGPHCCVIGGFVYRGIQIQGLRGRYVFADFCGSRLESFAWDGAQVSDHINHTADIMPCAGGMQPVIAMAEDSRGEIYLMTAGLGGIFKLVPGDKTSVRYCEAAPNSVGDGALMMQLGTTSEAANDLGLRARNAPPGQLGIFFYGDSRNSLPFGNGFRCVTGNTWRLGPPQAIADNGTATRWIDNQDPPTPQAALLQGRTFYFQFWYRDPAGGGDAFNLSDALRIDFCP